VKKGLAALVGVAFLFASAGLVAAQPPAPKMDDAKKMDTKMEDKKASSPKKHHTAVGTLKSAGPDGVVIASKAKGKEVEKTFAVDEKVKIKKGGKDITVKDLAPGDKVTVRYMDEGGKMTAMSISASTPKQAAKAKEEPAKDTTKK
jgi:uncharacterized protein YodC (DUF2158 family)